jgi:hypothetical protein
MVVQWAPGAQPQKCSPKIQLRAPDTQGDFSLQFSRCNPFGGAPFSQCSQFCGIRGFAQQESGVEGRRSFWALKGVEWIRANGCDDDELGVMHCPHFNSHSSLHNTIGILWTYGHKNPLQLSFFPFLIFITYYNSFSITIFSPELYCGKYYFLLLNCRQWLVAPIYH